MENTMHKDFRPAGYLERSPSHPRRYKRKKRFITLLTVFVLLAATLQTFYSPSIEASAASVVLVGAGDIASCSHNTDEATAKLLDQISGTVFAVGDLAYSSGTYSQFT